MNKQQFLANYRAVTRIEDMTLEEIAKIIDGAMNVEMPTINPIPYRGSIDQTVTYTYPELVARCPMTYIQDTYTVRIKFTPDKLIPELKSLKLYFNDFIDLPISHEHLQARIFRDFQMVVKPKKLSVTLDVAVRGGLHTVVEYEE